jgi:hypothetical protein
MAVLVLDQMKELDQKVAPPFGSAEQRANLRLRRRLDLAPFGDRPPAAPARAGMAWRLRQGMSFGHGNSNCLWGPMICSRRRRDNKALS